MGAEALAGGASVEILQVAGVLSVAGVQRSYGAERSQVEALGVPVVPPVVAAVASAWPWHGQWPPGSGPAVERRVME